MTKKAEKSMAYYLTRDTTTDGVLSQAIDVWLLKPEMVHVGLSYYWRLPGGDPDVKVISSSGPVPAHFGTWSIAKALLECRVYPDDSLMLIKVGTELEPAIAAEEL